MFVRQNNKGFSLVEMMVVIGIIAMILGLLITSFLDARQNSRDRERVSDLAQLEFALNAYRELNRSYPDYDEGVAIGLGGEIDEDLGSFWESEINDPLNDEEYHYYYNSEFECGGQRYVAIVAYNVEQQRNSNYSKVCESDSQTNETSLHPIYTLVGEVALAGGGGSSGGGGRGRDDDDDDRSSGGGGSPFPPSDPCAGGACIDHDDFTNSFVVLLEGPLSEVDDNSYTRGNNQGDWWEREENQTWADLRYNWDTIIDWSEEEQEEGYNACMDPTSDEFRLPYCRGCTDPSATNYDRNLHPDANDGSCTYAPSNNNGNSGNNGGGNDNNNGNSGNNDGDGGNDNNDGGGE